MRFSNWLVIVGCGYIKNSRLRFGYAVTRLTVHSLIITGVRDILVKSDANESRKKIMQNTRKMGHESAADGVGLFKDGQIPDEEELDKALESAHR